MPAPLVLRPFFVALLCLLRQYLVQLFESSSTGVPSIPVNGRPNNDDDDDDGLNTDDGRSSQGSVSSAGDRSKVEGGSAPGKAYSTHTLARTLAMLLNRCSAQWVAELHRMAVADAPPARAAQEVSEEVAWRKRGGGGGMRCSHPSSLAPFFLSLIFSSSRCPLLLTSTHTCLAPMLVSCVAGVILFFGRAERAASAAGPAAAGPQETGALSSAFGGGSVVGTAAVATAAAAAAPALSPRGRACGPGHRSVGLALAPRRRRQRPLCRRRPRQPAPVNATASPLARPGRALRAHASALSLGCCSLSLCISLFDASRPP